MQVSQTNPLQCQGRQRSGARAQSPRVSAALIQSGLGLAPKPFLPAPSMSVGTVPLFKSSSKSYSCISLQRKVYFAGKAAC